jgi:hypothetical protein
MTDFIMITENGEQITSQMPPDETEVEVLPKDGSTRLAYYACNISESGDYDFMPDDDLSTSIADDVVGWKLP